MLILILSGRQWLWITLQITLRDKSYLYNIVQEVQKRKWYKLTIG